MIGLSAAPRLCGNTVRLTCCAFVAAVLIVPAASVAQTNPPTPVKFGEVGSTRYNRVRYENTAGLTTTAPHPDLMSAPATDSGVTNALKRKEATTTIFAAWVPTLSPRMQLRLSGGAAIFAYSAEMVQAATYTQDATIAPALNAITINGSVNQEAKGGDLGLAVGADFTFFFTRVVGISGGVRYSRGTVTLEKEPLSKVRQDIRVGSTQILVGVRARFGG